MQLTLSKNTKPINHITRTFNDPLIITGFLREGCDIFNPDIEVEYNAAYLQYNYAYISDYGRYYYFSDPPTIEGKKMILHLMADSLYNFRGVILSSQCIAERSSSVYDLYLTDDAVASEAGYTYFSYSLPYTFHPENGKYILAVAGGV